MDIPGTKYDVVIIGAGIIGCYTAYFVKQRNPAIEIAVIDPDPTYEFASTVRASGGARRLFSCPENIEMSNFSIECIKRFETEMAVADDTAPVDWVEQGYLFIVSGADAMQMLEENATVQRSFGAEIELLDREGLRRLRRFEHYFTGHRRIEPLRYVKDLNRLAFRSEGQGFSGGLVDSSEPRGFNFDVDHDYFERVVWPAIAHRFPTAFEGARCHRTWSGLYEQCELDGNPIIGNWAGNHENFYVASGFSGHGMMHAPAAGRGIAELIDTGHFETIDLSRLGYRRVLDNAPYRERGIL